MAISGYEVRSLDVQIEPNGIVIRQKIDCPAGKKILSAGYTQVMEGGLEEVQLWEFGPTSAEAKAWWFSAVNNGNQVITIHLYLICAG